MVSPPADVTFERVTEGFSAGQAVSIDVDGEQVEGVFVRPGEKAEGVTVEGRAVVGPYKRDVAWVRRSDTGDVEAFLYEWISPRAA
jgi:hypothetical protein